MAASAFVTSHRSGDNRESPERGKKKKSEIRRRWCSLLFWLCSPPLPRISMAACMADMAATVAMATACPPTVTVSVMATRIPTDMGIRTCTDKRLPNSQMWLECSLQAGS
ncbi:Protein of unknown function [Gryllus bimaculatus]|nr:Protein of unknown function [Gryllus bimaculatus]